MISIESKKNPGTNKSNKNGRKNHKQQKNLKNHRKGLWNWRNVFKSATFRLLVVCSLQHLKISLFTSKKLFPDKERQTISFWMYFRFTDSIICWSIRERSSPWLMTKTWSLIKNLCFDFKEVPQDERRRRRRMSFHNNKPLFLTTLLCLLMNHSIRQTWHNSNSN